MAEYTSTLKNRSAAERIASMLSRNSTESIRAFMVNAGYFPKFRAISEQYIEDINMRARQAGREYMAGFSRRREIECRVMGIPPWPEKRNEERQINMTNRRPPSARKKANSHKKRAKWETNHAERAEINRRRSNDTRNNPTFHGFGHI